MGYAHYWIRPLCIEDIVFEGIIADFKTLLPLLEEAGVRLGGASGTGSAIFNADELCFNGAVGQADESYETFRFARVSQTNRGTCKTGRKPYDLAVTAALLVARKVLGDRLDLSSDGGPEAWEKARLICAHLARVDRLKPIQPCQEEATASTVES